MEPIYLDYNATTPVDLRVVEAMRPFFYPVFGNPSSGHSAGLKAKTAVEKARAEVAALLECSPDEVIFTSGGSESNNYALKGVAYASREKGRHIITSAIEHPSVAEVCRFLEKQGFEVTRLPVDGEGLVHPSSLRDALRPDTVLVSVMHANNEVGTIQPVRELAAMAHEAGTLFHTDAAQSVGKIPVTVHSLGVDLLSLAGHKLYAPKGIGVLYVKSGIQLEKLIHGADHEQGRRAGTENVPEIVGLGRAAAIARAELEKNSHHCREMRDLLETTLKEKLSGIKIHAAGAARLPNTSSVSFPGVEAHTLLGSLEGVAASAGAACHTGDVQVSAVLEAMKIPSHYAMGTVRFSTGRGTTRKEVLDAAARIAAAARELQGNSEAAAAADAPGPQKIKLTRYTHGLGCACKLRPRDLEQVLRKMPFLKDDPNVLVGHGTADDAAVYRINDRQAIVQTLDFFTPVVDESYHFGAIAAANALSDIYAMGGRPLFALNIVGFPVKRLPLTVLEEILKGASDKAREAGIAILGGHSVEDTEPKFGLAVTGMIEPGRVIKNQGARPGDRLILTKPIGTGIVTTAIKKGLAGEEASREAIQVMGQLNAGAARIMQRYEVHACTDVTGFGLTGHLREMILGTGTGVELHFDQVPLIRGASAFAQQGILPGGTISNHEFVAGQTLWDPAITLTEQYLLCDAQTSGGLLIAVRPEDAEVLSGEMKETGIYAAEIGIFGTENPAVIRVVR